jgi:hypothetical protein
MPEKKAVRAFFTVLSLAAAPFGLGWAMLGKNPVPGLILMSIGILYLLYEICDLPWVRANIPGMFRLLLLVFAGCTIAGLFRVPIKSLFQPHSPSVPSTTARPEIPTGPKPNSETAEDSPQPRAPGTNSTPPRTSIRHYSDHQELELVVSIVGPTSPAIVVDNQADKVAEGVTWELVMFRTSDQAFFSYATQSIGYVKAHSKSARYAMDLNTLPHAQGVGQVANGDKFIGSLSIDCPSCRGTTLIVSFVWGISGWFCEMPNGRGHLLLPKDMSKESVSRFIALVDSSVKSNGRIPVL